MVESIGKSRENKNFMRGQVKCLVFWEGYSPECYTQMGAVTTSLGFNCVHAIIEEGHVMPPLAIARKGPIKREASCLHTYGITRPCMPCARTTADSLTRSFKSVVTSLPTE